MLQNVRDGWGSFRTIDVNVVGTGLPDALRDWEVYPAAEILFSMRTSTAGPSTAAGPFTAPGPSTVAGPSIAASRAAPSDPAVARPPSTRAPAGNTE